MKRSRIENIPRDGIIKKTAEKNVIFRCRFAGCNFVACTEHNISSHERAKHTEKIQKIINMEN
jgi:hypothetical protein